MEDSVAHASRERNTHEPVKVETIMRNKAAGVKTLVVRDTRRVKTLVVRDTSTEEPGGIDSSTGMDEALANALT